MNFTLFFHFSLIGLLHVCTASVPAQRETTDENKPARTHLHDINDDVLFIIFDDLTISDILNLLEAYPANALSGVGNHYFRRSYQDYIIEIDGRFNPNKRVTFSKNSNRLVDGRDGNVLLQHFGAEIRDLKVQNPSNTTFQYINKYARALKKLDINYNKDDPFECFTNPFNELEIVSIRSSRKIKSGLLSFNELFPKIRRLELWSNNDIDRDSFSCKFQLLEEVKLTIDFMREKTHVYGLLSNNPHIRGVEYDGDLSQEFCDAINNLVPNLESLTVERFDISSGTRFKNVNNLKIGRHSKNIDKLSFPLLKSIEIKFTDGNIPNWAKFAEQHQLVTHFKIIDVYGNGQDKLINMTTAFSNLIGIMIAFSDSSGTAFYDEVISEIIMRNAMLKNVNIIMSHASDDQVERLQELFQNEWNITLNQIEGRYLYDRKTDFFFERNEFY